LNGIFIETKSTAEIFLASKRQAEMTARLQSLSDAVISWSHIGHFLTEEYFEMELVGFPVEKRVGVETRKVKPTQNVQPPNRPGSFERSAGGVFKIIHCPSNPSAKGTNRLKDEISSIASAEFQLTVEVVTGEKNKVVREKLRDADLVVDQLYSDSLPSVFSTEALEEGVPVIMAGWTIASSPHAKRFAPGLTVCHPDEVLALLKGEMAQAGRSDAPEPGSSQPFDISSWSSDTVARRLLVVAGLRVSSEGDNLEPLVRTQPGSRGGFAQESVVAKSVQNLLSEYGPEALHLGHNPVLLEDLILFAADNSS